MDEEIIISKEMLRAINSDTRICILKSLSERQKTQTELATELKRSLPTVLEHIEQLETARLIVQLKDEKERKWKYYALTKTGRAIIEKKRMNFVLLLVSSMLAAFGSLYLLLSTQYSQPAVLAINQTSSHAQIPISSLPLLELVIFVIAIIVSLLAVYWLVKKKY